MGDGRAIAAGKVIGTDVTEDVYSGSLQEWSIWEGKSHSSSWSS